MATLQKVKSLTWAFPQEVNGVHGNGTRLRTMDARRPNIDHHPDRPVHEFYL